MLMQDILDLARNDVNDTAQSRYLDSDGIKYANDGIVRAMEIRPDLKFGSYGTAYTDLTTASAFPLPIEFRAKIAHYVVFCWQSTDDEFVNDGTAKMSRDLYVKELLSVE